MSQIMQAPRPGGVNSTSIAELQQRIAPRQQTDTPAQQATVKVSMDTVAGFEALQRQARLFSESSIVPTSFQGSIPNCFIALDMALRMGANPMALMQQMYIVHGKPSFSSAFLIATFNSCGRYTAIKYGEVGEKGKDSWGYYAKTVELATGAEICGPTVTIEMAKKEGWYAKTGSKWQTMPELMLKYRAAAFMIRTTAPELAMGLQTAEDIRDEWQDENVIITSNESIGSQDQPQNTLPTPPKRRNRLTAKQQPIEQQPQAKDEAPAVIETTANPVPENVPPADTALQNRFDAMCRERGVYGPSVIRWREQRTDESPEQIMQDLLQNPKMLDAAVAAQQQATAAAMETANQATPPPTAAPQQRAAMAM